VKKYEGKNALLAGKLSWLPCLVPDNRIKMGFIVCVKRARKSSKLRQK
jgi:hypothetical protein